MWKYKITGPGPSDSFFDVNNDESQPSGWLSVVLIGCAFIQSMWYSFTLICHTTYHWGQAPLIGFPFFK